MVTDETVNEVRKVREHQEYLNRIKDYEKISNLELLELFEDVINENDINKKSELKVELYKRLERTSK